MKLFTFTLVLSLLALAGLTQAHMKDLESITKCTKVGTTVVAAFVRASVPELRTYLKCIDYTPPPNPHNCLLGYAKAIYELLKRSVLGNINCLVDPLKKGVEFLKPNIAQIDELKCLD